jgi:hypothetical protein
MPLTKIQSLGITDGTIVNADINASAAIASTKLSGVGKVLQVVSTVKTDTFSTSSTSYTAVTGLSASITPSSSSNKILVLVQITLGTSSYTAHYSIRRGATDILLADTAGSRTRTTAVASPGDTDADRKQITVSTVFLDSPSTTSSTTYQAHIAARRAIDTVYINRSHNDNNGSEFDPRTTSTITVMEIAG